MRISSLPIIGLLLLTAAPHAVGQQAVSVTGVRIVVSSGTLQLTGLLWRPAGSGPFPAVLFTHGGGRPDPAQAEVLGPVFAKHGYVFLYLFRRGAGLSSTQGENMRDVLDREEQARGVEASRRLQLVLLTTDHLSDVINGLAVLKHVAGVDATRVAVAGHSFGGQLALLAAERDHSLGACVTFAAAAQSWDGFPELQERLIAAVRNIRTPIFLTHAANDFSTAPGQALAAELTRLKQPHELRIYPAVGDRPGAGHGAVYSDVRTWETDVFRFLDEHLWRR
jgi:dienelactone hydrolase